MELRQAIQEQCHAGLAMLAECVEKCPEDLWLEGEYPRAFWRVAWHAAYFTHHYLVQLDDPKSLPFVQGAIEEEAIPELREDMLQLMHQLEDTARWHSSFAK